MDGCPGRSGLVFGAKCFEVTELHAVRCCKLDETNVCYGSICEPTFIESGNAATLPQAVAECASRGQRLCDASELEDRVCCTSGCGMDKNYVWSASSCTGASTPSPSPPVDGFLAVWIGIIQGLLGIASYLAEFLFDFPNLLQLIRPS